MVQLKQERPCPKRIGKEGEVAAEAALQEEELYPVVRNHLFRKI